MQQDYFDKPQNSTYFQSTFLLLAKACVLPVFKAMVGKLRAITQMNELFGQASKYGFSQFWKHHEKHTIKCDCALRLLSRSYRCANIVSMYLYFGALNKLNNPYSMIGADIESKALNASKYCV